MKGGTKKSSLAKIVLTPGGKSPAHYHPVVEETYYMLSGKGGRMIIGKDRNSQINF